MDNSLIIPIYRRDNSKYNFLEIITEKELLALFSDNVLDDEFDVSSLGIHLLSSQGMSLLKRVYKRTTDKLVQIITERGKKILLPADQKLAILESHNISELFGKVSASSLSVGDTLIEFAGEFSNIYLGKEYIDLINTLLVMTSKEKLTGIYVVGVREYLRSISNHEKNENSMALTKFSSYIVENGVFDDELDFLKLSSIDNSIQVGSKLFLTSSLFEFLGYFWKYGYFENNIPILKVPSYKIARKILRIVKKAFNSGSTITPVSKNVYSLSMQSSIYTIVLRDIFGLHGNPSRFKLPENIYNVENEFISSFIRSLLDQNDEIVSEDSDAIQEIQLLLNILNIHPKLVYDRDRIIITFTTEEIKSIIDREVHEDKSPTDTITSIESIHLDEVINTYFLDCGDSYFAGSGILMCSFE